MARITVLRINPKNPDPRTVARAAKAIRNGKVIAFPTETVYGLGTNAFSETGAEEIFRLKGRPETKPLLILIADRKDLKGVVKTIPKSAKKLMDAFWPGPLTIVFKKSKKIPRVVSAGGNTIGVRLSSHPIARALVRAAGVPITAPSANLAGERAHRSSQGVLRELRAKGLTLLIDGGRTPLGTPSTIVDVTKRHPLIIREGSISKKEIQKVLD